jgi:DNA-binding NarL/FixJ family response regulator
LRVIQDRALSLHPDDILLTAQSLDDDLRRVQEDAAALLAGSMPGAGDLELHPYGLSSREMEVMVHVWQGLSDKQIALEMGISRFTVAKHLGAGMRKMNVQTRTQASVLFEREGLYKRSV